MKTAPKAPVPLKTLELLPARVVELLTLLDGQPMPYDYPKWVRAIGADLVPVLPPKIAAAAKKDAKQLLWGVLAGFSVACTDNPSLAEVAPEDEGWLSRSVKMGGNPALGKFNAAELPAIICSAKEEIAAELPLRLALPAAARSAFFEGFACGLSLLEEFKNIGANTSAERISLRLYLWCRWPEIVECGSIPAAYEKCRSAFEKNGAAELVGSEQAFKKFCNRYGISFRTQQEAKRRQNKKQQ